MPAEFTIAALELSSIAVLGAAMTLHAILAENAQKAPDRPWLRFEGASWTYAEGEALTDKMAHGLRAQGVEPGDRVALLLANCPELVFCYFACFKIGAVAVPLNRRFQIAELVYALNHSGAKILIGQPDLIAPLMAAKSEVTALERIFVTKSSLPGTESYSVLMHDKPTTHLRSLKTSWPCCFIHPAPPRAPRG